MMRSRKGIRTEENGKRHGTESSHSVGKSCHSKHRALAAHAIKKQQLIETGRDVFPDINLALYLDRGFFSVIYLEAVCILDLPSPILHCFVPVRLSLTLLPKALQRLWSSKTLLWPLVLPGSRSCLVAGGGISPHYRASVILL